MSWSSLAEALVEPLFEGALRLVCYGTAVVLVPIFSFGRASVEGAAGMTVRPRWHGFGRRSDGHILVHADTATLLGIAFWSVLAVAGVAVVAARSRDEARVPPSPPFAVPDRG